MPSNIPSRFSQRAFCRYAPFIGKALAQYPTVLRVVPENVSCETFAQRCRDAFSAKKKYGWHHEDVDETLWQQHGYSLQVSLRDNCVLIGNAEALKTARDQSITNLADTSASTNEIEIDCTQSTDALHLVCKLLASRSLNPQPMFFVRGLPQAYLNGLENNYDVSFVPDEKDATKYRII